MISPFLLCTSCPCGQIGTKAMCFPFMGLSGHPALTSAPGQNQSQCDLWSSPSGSMTNNRGCPPHPSLTLLQEAGISSSCWLKSVPMAAAWFYCLFLLSSIFLFVKICIANFFPTISLECTSSLFFSLSSHGQNQYNFSLFDLLELPL